MSRRTIGTLLALTILCWLSPFLEPFARVAAAENHYLAALEASARAMELEPLLLTDPEAYQEQIERLATYHKAAAVAELDARSRPDPAVMARAHATISDVRHTHAAAALLALPHTLQQFREVAAQARAALPSGNHLVYRDQFVAYTILVDSAQADLDQMITNSQLHLGSQTEAQSRFATFAEAARDHLDVLTAAFEAVPATNAPPAVWDAYLTNVEQTLDEALTEHSLPAVPQAVFDGLASNRVQGIARIPRISAHQYALEEGLVTTPEILASAAQRFFPDLSLSTLSSSTDGSLAQARAAIALADQLGATPDIQMTPDLLQVAATLTRDDGTPDPVAIFNYVHNLIDSELYYGSKKGSQGTLYERAGNDIDQASLLIGLLRVSDIPARYATGRVWLTEEIAQGLTRTSSGLAAADVFVTAGYPARHIIRSLDGTIPNVVEIEHTWVQAFLPYEHYRGVLERDTGSAWVNLSPFVKEFRFNNPVDLRGSVPFNVDAYLNSDVTAGLPVDIWQDDLRDYIRTVDNCETLLDATRLRTIIPANYKLLPAELPLRVMNQLAITTEVPSGQRYGMQIRIENERGTDDLSTDTLLLPATYGQRIDVTFEPATAADAQTIASYGGLYQTPPYLVNVRPILRVGEAAIASGAAVRPGTERELIVSFITPGLSSADNTIDHTMNAGGVYVVGRDYQLIPQRLIDDAEQRLVQMRTQNASAAALEAQQLHITILRYFQAYNRGLTDVSGILQHHYIRDLAAGFMTRQLKVTTNFLGAPTSVAEGNYLIDISKLTLTPYDAEAQQTDAVEVMTLVGYNSSALEHTILQQQYGRQAVSAVKGLQYAASEGQTLQTITSAGQIGSLNVSQSVKDSIRDAVNQGWVVRAPQRTFSYNGWNGVGFIVSDPATGSGAYLLEGNLNGGESTNAFLVSAGCRGRGAPPACGTAGNLFDMFYNSLLSIVGDPVNLSTGNMIDSYLDLTVPSKGIPLSFERWYNSLEPQDGRMGWGWSDTYSQRIIAQDDGSLQFHDIDGHIWVYTPSDGSNYSRPAGSDLELTATGTTYTLKDTTNYQMTFARSTGRLQTITDILGNTVTLSYDDDRLTSITDAAGRIALTFSYNGQGRLSAVTDVDGRRVAYSYDNAGNLTSVTDVRGQLWTYSYDTDHRMTGKSDPLGNSDTFAYDAEGRMYRHINALGQVESFSYDPYNGRAVYTRANGANEIYAFDERGRIVQYTDALGNSSTGQWDADDNQIAVTDARGNTTQHAYNDQRQRTRTVDESGVETVYEYSPQGMPTRIATTLNGETVEQTWTYADDGRLLSHITPEGTTTYTMTSAGEVTGIATDDGIVLTQTFNNRGLVASQTQQVTLPDGTTQTKSRNFTYSAGGFVAEVDDTSGRSIRFVNDPSGRPLEVYRSDDTLFSRIAYDEKGQAVSVTDGATYTMTASYDALGRNTVREDIEGILLQQTFDEMGRVLTRTGADGNTVAYEYDLIGRKIRQINPDGGVFAMGYCANTIEVCETISPLGVSYKEEKDEQGRPIAITNGLGHTTAYTYDEFGRLASMTDAENFVTSYTYDTSGRLTEVVDAADNITTYTYGSELTGASPILLSDPNGNTRRFSYDERGRKTAIFDGLNNETRIFYGDGSNVTRIEFPNGNTLSYTYNDNGAITNTTGPDGTTTFTYSDGNIATQTNDTTALTFDYTPQGELARLTQLINGTAHGIDYTYTERGEVATITNHEGDTVQYDYDATARLVGITGEDNQRVTFAYDVDGRRTRMTLPNGVTTHYFYDKANQLTAQVSQDRDGTTVAAFRYTYDRRGLRTSMTDLNGQVTTYTYDGLERLTAVNYGGGRVQTFTYDGAGNRLSMTDGGTTTTYTYNAANQLIQESRPGETVQYTYDANGNLTSKDSSVDGETSYLYNHYDLLTGIELPSGDQWRFGYGPNGLRVFEEFISGGVTRRVDMLNDGPTVLTDYVSVNDTPTTTTHYLYGPSIDELFGQQTNGEWVYFIQDDKGTVSVLLDASGKVVGRRSYDAFGAVATQSGIWTTRYGFTGREDIGATGLMYYRARVYDTNPGLFMTSDPQVLSDLTLPQSLNLYGYTVNDPVNRTDPLGQSPLDIFWNSVGTLTSEFVKYTQMTLWLDGAKTFLGLIFKFGQMPSIVARIAVAALTGAEFTITMHMSMYSLLNDYEQSGMSDVAQKAFLTLPGVFFISTAIAMAIAMTKDVAGLKPKEPGAAFLKAAGAELWKKVKEIVFMRLTEILMKTIIKVSGVTKDTLLGVSAFFGLRMLLAGIKFFYTSIVDESSPWKWKYIGKFFIDVLKSTLSPEFNIILVLLVSSKPNNPRPCVNGRGRYCTKTG